MVCQDVDRLFILYPILLQTIIINRATTLFGMSKSTIQQ